MLAAMVIVVTCLFFLGLGLLISTNPLVVLALALVGLILGGLAGILLLRGRVAQEYHWSLFAGPAATGLLFVLLCGVLNLLVSDNLGLALGGARMYSVALLLGTAPGLFIGLVLGNSMGNARRRPARPLVGQQPSATAYQRPVVAAPRPPGPPPAPLPATTPWATPGPAAAPHVLADRLAEELPALVRFGEAQILDPHDGTLCVVLTRQADGLAIYMVCSAAYPQQPPTVKVERAGAAINVGSGVHFPWTASSRLEQIVADLLRRV
jgi:hypothetical protein